MLWEKIKIIFCQWFFRSYKRFRGLNAVNHFFGCVVVLCHVVYGADIVTQHLVEAADVQAQGRDKRHDDKGRSKPADKK